MKELDIIIELCSRHCVRYFNIFSIFRNYCNINMLSTYIVLIVIIIIFF